MGARILLVEDNPTNLKLMEYLLRAFGHTTVSAIDGAGGVARAVREAPDLVLMDLQMPTVNGYDAARQIKAIPTLQRVPIVAVTALAMVGDRDKILAHGFDGYIPKPIVPETFVSQVEAFLPKRPAPFVSTTATPPLPPTVGRGRLILVVDNSPVNLALAVSTFEPFGYRVVSATSASEGLEAARRRHPALIISDVHMPGQGGYELLRLVKQDARLRAIPFVLISSTVWAEADRAAALAQGADGFILRPIEPPALLAEVARYLHPSAGAAAPAPGP